MFLHFDSGWYRWLYSIRENRFSNSTNMVSIKVPVCNAGWFMFRLYHREVDKATISSELIKDTFSSLQSLSTTVVLRI